MAQAMDELGKVLATVDGRMQEGQSLAGEQRRIQGLTWRLESIDREVMAGFANGKVHPERHPSRSRHRRDHGIRWSRRPAQGVEGRLVNGGHTQSQLKAPPV